MKYNNDYRSVDSFTTAGRILQNFFALTKINNRLFVLLLLNTGDALRVQLLDMVKKFIYYYYDNYHHYTRVVITRHSKVRSVCLVQSSHGIIMRTLTRLSYCAISPFSISYIDFDYIFSAFLKNNSNAVIKI